MTVLILTHSADHRGVERVIEALAQRGVEALRLDSDRFPSALDLTIEQGPARSRVAMRVDGVTHSLDEVDAIWFRRLRPPELPAGMRDDVREAALGEVKAVLRGLLNGLSCFRLDPWDRVQHAHHKQRQLEHARAVGLSVPPTLITNSPAAVRAFAADCPGGVVTKMLSGFTLEREGQEQVVFTNALSEDDLANLDGLRLCPMVFQARIERVMELRCTVVGHRIFCGALPASASAVSGDDWRRAGNQLGAAWSAHELPPAIAEQLLALATRLGLNYGAADLLVDAQGVHHFLELNPGGEYGWIEHSCGLPISEAIAEVLADPRARRVQEWTP